MARQSSIDDIETRYNSLPDKKELTQEQINAIQDFFRTHMNATVPVNWHKYFYSRNDKFSVEYLPASVSSKLVRWANRGSYRDAYADKNILDNILPNALHPKIIMKNMNGYFYFNNKSVTREEALKLCSNLGRVIIKPSLRSQGNGIKVITIKDGMTDDNNLSLSELFDSYRMDYCIQEIIVQHEKMKALNPSSVNTIRILSYRSEMEILILYTAIRIGRKDTVIDNESKGGMSANINSNGIIDKYAYALPQEGKIEVTDSGIKLEGYVVPSYDKAVKLVQEQHLNLPFFDIVAWDIAIREDGEPIIIEWNVFPGLSQSACGPALGKYTERIIHELKEKYLKRNRLLQKNRIK